MPFLTTIDIGDVAVSNDWPLPCNMVNIVMDRTVKYQLCAVSMKASTIVELVVGLLVVGLLVVNLLVVNLLVVDLLVV